MQLINRWITPDTVLWAAAAVSFALLVLTVPVAGILSSQRRDSVMRLMKVGIILLLIVLVGLPFLVLVTGEKADGRAVACFLLFFPIFCYYQGKILGLEKGRRNVTDLIGLDDFDNMEDAQDRLYESRLRHPRRESVVQSIKDLSAGGKPAGGEGGRGNSRKSEVMEVAVEEV